MHWYFLIFYCLFVCIFLHKKENSCKKDRLNPILLCVLRTYQLQSIVLKLLHWVEKNAFVFFGNYAVKAISDFVMLPSILPKLILWKVLSTIFFLILRLVYRKHCLIAYLNNNSTKLRGPQNFSIIPLFGNYHNCFIFVIFMSDWTIKFNILSTKTRSK